ncbi:MAG: hypothetical protein LBB94_10310, partial [Clostridiales bacterium]|nr:hypothetical protein [Clostridiales bacterium]
MFNKRKFFTALTAISISTMLIAGTFAWISVNSSRVNSWSGKAEVDPAEGPGGTLHDDYCENGENKDVYVENWGGYP